MSEFLWTDSSRNRSSSIEIRTRSCLWRSVRECGIHLKLILHNPCSSVKIRWTVSWWRFSLLDNVCWERGGSLSRSSLIRSASSGSISRPGLGNASSSVLPAAKSRVHRCTFRRCITLYPYVSLIWDMICLLDPPISTSMKTFKFDDIFFLYRQKILFDGNQSHWIQGRQRSAQRFYSRQDRPIDPRMNWDWIGAMTWLTPSICSLVHRSLADRHSTDTKIGPVLLLRKLWSSVLRFVWSPYRSRDIRLRSHLRLSAWFSLRALNFQGGCRNQSIFQ
jgi:hypothetical protein